VSPAADLEVDAIGSAVSDFFLRGRPLPLPLPFAAFCSGGVIFVFTVFFIVFASTGFDGEFDGFGSCSAGELDELPDAQSGGATPPAGGGTVSGAGMLLADGTTID
jgi:hypothetical protein